MAQYCSTWTSLPAGPLPVNPVSGIAPTTSAASFMTPVPSTEAVDPAGTQQGTFGSLFFVGNRELIQRPRVSSAAELVGAGLAREWRRLHGQFVHIPGLALVIVSAKEEWRDVPV